MKRTIAVTITLLIAFASVALAQRADEPIRPLTRVEPKTVCMVNEMAMGRDQIPVQVEGRTYFGCCEMCKNRLAKDASIRVATDPISGKEVDKSTAIIGADSEGRVKYFENEENFKKYNEAAAKS